MIIVMDAAYQLLPIDAQQKEFRLITILPPCIDTRLRCSLRRVSLLQLRNDYNRLQASQTADFANTSDLLRLRTGTEQSTTFPQDRASHRFQWGDFAALSYAWGDPQDTTDVEVNGVETRITRTLATALHCLRQTGGFDDAFSLWVDALCINQRDSVERGQQVALMRQYYSTAWSVIGFLGPSGEESEKAISLIRELSVVYNDDGKRERLRESYTTSKGHPHTPGSWLALAKVVRRPCWTRLWIVQELTLGADRAVLYCGTDEVRWEIFCQAIESIHLSLWLVKYSAIEHDCLTLADEGHLYEVDCALMHIQRDLLMLSNLQQSRFQSLDLRRLMEISAYSICSDPRDRVYGMLGVMNADVARLIEPDYTVTAADAFVCAAKAHMSVHRNMELLRDTNLWGRSGAPTWVPDWTWTGRQRDSRPDDATPGRMEYSERMERRPYSAHRGMSFHLPLHQGRRLLCHVALFDRVDGLGTNHVAGVY
ncbi:hypothetical protein LTR37_014308 [Vermiconidia calcicola]|uniref:Uncharacterized protein n=1 Tax=Vermiconidia calcicola TaxID=1690605 RepID=A0ACC3MTZ5_9PEZI|nr:hypothetical protein LTR37_014308 [Vermiconidia calcicola]